MESDEILDIFAARITNFLKFLSLYYDLEYWGYTLETNIVNLASRA